MEHLIAAASAHGAFGGPAIKHVGLIMDGNGRWASERGLPRRAGHAFGAERLWPVIDEALSLRIYYLTVFAFSIDNWKRDAPEVGTIFSVIRWMVVRRIHHFHARGVRFRWSGSRGNLPPNLVEVLDSAEELTRANTVMTVTLCVDHSGRSDILRAVRSIANSIELGELDSSNVGENTIDSHMQWPDLPRVDIAIRTSGEQRISNFLIWHMANARLVFVEKYWPDFTPADFREAVNRPPRLRTDDDDV